MLDAGRCGAGSTADLRLQHLGARVGEQEGSKRPAMVGGAGRREANEAADQAACGYSELPAGPFCSRLPSASVPEHQPSSGLRHSSCWLSREHPQRQTAGDFPSGAAESAQSPSAGCRMTASAEFFGGRAVLGWLFRGRSCWPGRSRDIRQRAAVRVPWQVVDIRPPTRGAWSWLSRSTWAVPRQRAAR
jgi:hypothetical protein